MQFLTSELRNVRSIQREEDLPADELLGPAPEFVQFKHPVNAKVTAELIYSEILVTGQVSTVVNFDCSRCLKNFERKVAGEFKQSFPLESEVIDVTQLLKETIIIDLPLNAVCEESCKGICPNCGGNRNLSECRCAPQEHKPQWDALKDIQLKRKK